MSYRSEIKDKASLRECRMQRKHLLKENQRLRDEITT